MFLLIILLNFKTTWKIAQLFLFLHLPMLLLYQLTLLSPIKLVPKVSNNMPSNLPLYSLSVYFTLDCLCIKFYQYTRVFKKCNSFYDNIINFFISNSKCCISRSNNVPSNALHFFLILLLLLLKVEIYFSLIVQIHVQLMIIYFLLMAQEVYQEITFIECFQIFVFLVILH